MKRFYTRSDWGARAAGPREQQAAPLEAFIHYSSEAGASGVRSLAAQKAKMRGFQNYHMDANGWSDIGYHWVVFQAYGLVPGARAFQARPVEFVPAAQAGHNTRTLAICVHAGPGDELKRNTRWLVGEIVKKYPTVRVIGGHRDVVATSCPGDRIYSQIPRLCEATGRRRYKR